MADLHLLHADEEQIDRASIAIADGTAFVVALCPVAARLAALTYLRTHLKELIFPEAVEIGTADEMFAALSEQVDQKNRVLSVTLGRDVLGPFDALNLHREKVLKGGPVILWLGDVHTLRTMRERAPDAYSYRTTMMVIRGDGGAFPAPSVEESEEIKAVRRRLKRAKLPLARAAEAYNLADGLRVSGKFIEAAEMARAALLALSHATTDKEREVRALSCRTLALVESAQSRETQALYWARRSYAELESRLSATALLDSTVYILRIWPGPFDGHDRERVREALSLVRRFGLPVRDHVSALLSAIDVSVAQGDLAKAFQLLAEAAMHKVVKPGVIAGRLLRQGNALARRGNLLDAEELFRSTALEEVKAGSSTIVSISRLINSMGLRGELASVERLVEEKDALGVELADTSYAQAKLNVARGDIEMALAEFRQMYTRASQSARDGDIMNIAVGMVEIVISAHDAHRLPPQQIELILSDLELAHDVIMNLSGPDGPEWYPIQLRSWRAEVLRIAGKPAEALNLLRQTLDLARNTYPDLVPETGRILVDHLIYAQQFDEALELIDEIEPIALEMEFLEERARLLADRILALVGKNTAAEQIAPHVHELRSALAATDSKRITAETLRHLAERLPSTTTFPEPISLADEAHRLFVAMPIPAEEAMCLEIMGDVLASRGQVEEAKMRYANARGRLERHGLLLRVPLIEEKLLRS